MLKNATPCEIMCDNTIDVYPCDAPFVCDTFVIHYNVESTSPALMYTCWGSESSQPACMQIIHHICECLSDLHATGYVHRDLKPENVMWLPSQNRWTLIDLGCAARIGEPAPLGFANKNLRYCAPEVARANMLTQQSLEATSALDMWSVGVIAVEIFSGASPLPASQPHEKVHSALSHVTPMYCLATLYSPPIILYLKPSRKL